MLDQWTERKHQQLLARDGDHRSPYQRDKARILHSAAFRRLQAKTQVLGVGMSDFYRTRLTHSLEVSQIGQGIAAQLRQKHPKLTQQLQLNDNLIEALCLAHDIGHPPFGHGGEVALHYMMREEGGFEGNGQTFRIISKLEPYTQHNGMNLCRRTILGLVKYPNTLSKLNRVKAKENPVPHRQIKANQWHPPKGLYDDDLDMFNWLLSGFTDNDIDLFTSLKQQGENRHLKTRFKSFDCSIMELADDIAYSIHDLEDAIVMGIIRQEDFISDIAIPLSSLGTGWLQESIEQLAVKLFSRQHYERKDAIGALVNVFVTAITIEQTDKNFDSDVLKYNAILPKPFALSLTEFKNFVYRRVIRKPEIQLLEYKGQQVVMELFEAFSSDPERLLPENTRVRWKESQSNHGGARVICDYIAGMTDEFASRLYTNLFVPRAGNLQENSGI